MEYILSWLLYSLAILATAYVLPGVRVTNFFAAFITALILGILNTFIKPVLLFLTLPINVLTLGLFTFVINALLVLLASAIVPGFKVDNFWWALIFAIVVSIINYLLTSLVQI